MFKDTLETQKKLILASKSPRRQTLLRELGYDFEVRTKEVLEDYPGDMILEEVAAFLAEKKAKCMLEDLAPDEVVLTSDTTVVVDGRILGKPADGAEAREMLELLSGRMHKVYTGMCAGTLSGLHTVTECTEVTFRQLTGEEIEYYIIEHTPFDKAGGYGIQDWIGMVGITEIRGSYFNVVGLPTHRVRELLSNYL